MEVTVIGTGYVGTVTGACLAYLGHHVTCVDTDASKIARLQRGESPIYEPLLEQMMALAAERGGLDFTAELAGAVRASDVIFIAVGTPPLPSGEANLAYLEAAAKSSGGQQIHRAGRLRQPGGNPGARRPDRPAPRGPNPLRRSQ